MAANIRVNVTIRLCEDGGFELVFTDTGKVIEKYPPGSEIALAIDAEAEKRRLADKWIIEMDEVSI